MAARARTTRASRAATADRAAAAPGDAGAVEADGLMIATPCYGRMMHAACASCILRTLLAPRELGILGF
jgi:hypothetical protein